MRIVKRIRNESEENCTEVLVTVEDFREEGETLVGFENRLVDIVNKCLNPTQTMREVDR